MASELIYIMPMYARIPVHLKFISMLGISQRSNRLNEYMWMEYNQFSSFNENLH